MTDLSYEQTKAALIEEVTCAFDGVSREGGISLSEAWAIDLCVSDKKRAKARKRDTETRWQDVPDEDINNGYSCLSFLDAIGFHYYIPAYIVWFLRHVDDDSTSPHSGSMTLEFLIYALGALGNDPARHSKFELLSPSQCQAVAHFLEFEEARHYSEERMEDEWLQQEPRPESTSWETFFAAWREAQEFPEILRLSNSDARRALNGYWKKFIE